MGLRESAIAASVLLLCLAPAHALMIAPLHDALDESPMVELVGGHGGAWSYGHGGRGMHGAGGGRRMTPPARATHGPGWNAGMQGAGNGNGNGGRWRR